MQIKGREPGERDRFMIRIGRRQPVMLGSTWDWKMADFKAEGRQLALTWGSKKLSFKGRHHLCNMKVHLLMQRLQNFPGRSSPDH